MALPGPPLIRNCQSLLIQLPDGARVTSISSTANPRNWTVHKTITAATVQGRRKAWQPNAHASGLRESVQADKCLSWNLSTLQLLDILSVSTFYETRTMKIVVPNNKMELCSSYIEEFFPSCYWATFFSLYVSLLITFYRYQSCTGWRWWHFAMSKISQFGLATVFSLLRDVVPPHLSLTAYRAWLPHLVLRERANNSA